MQQRKICIKNANIKIEKISKKLNTFEIGDKQYARYATKLKNAEAYKNKIDNHLLKSELDRDWKKTGKKSTVTNDKLKEMFKSNKDFDTQH